MFYTLDSWNRILHLGSQACGIRVARPSRNKRKRNDSVGHALTVQREEEEGEEEAEVEEEEEEKRRQVYVARDHEAHFACQAQFCLDPGTLAPLSLSFSISLLHYLPLFPFASREPFRGHSLWPSLPRSDPGSD